MLGKPKAASDGQLRFLVPKTAKDGGGGYNRIAEGAYPGRCTGVVFEHAKSSGNPMWTWTFVQIGGPAVGREWKLWTALTDDAAWKVVQTLEALGVEVEVGEEVAINKKDVIGVGCLLKIRDDNGKDGKGEFSKLDTVQPHPKGAGYRPGKLDVDDERDYPAEIDEGEEAEPTRRAAPPKGKGGKASSSLGRKR